VLFQTKTGIDKLYLHYSISNLLTTIQQLSGDYMLKERHGKANKEDIDGKNFKFQ